MKMETIRKELKIKFNQLEWLIIAMAGCTLASLQIIRFVIFNSGIQPTILQMTLDWLFAMVIISGLVHFSFREMSKIQCELISKREQANKAEQRMQHIIDMTQDTIFIIDNDGDFTFSSRSVEKLTGYSQDTIHAMNIADILTSEYRSFIMKKLNKYDEISSNHLYVDFLQKDQSIVPVEIGFIPIKDHSGRITGFQGIARDITEHRETEKAHKEKEAYLQAIASIGQKIIENNSNLPYQDIIGILKDASTSEQAFIVLDKKDVVSSGNSDILAKIIGELGNSEDDTIEMQPVLYGTENSEYSGEMLLHDLYRNGSIITIPQKEAIVLDSSISQKTLLVTPIVVGEKHVGIIGFSKDKKSETWKSVHTNLLRAVANLLSQAIERHNANTQLKRHFISLSRIMSQALSTIDPYTAIHQQRVAQMVCLVGEKMQMNPKQIEWLYFCGLLHDVGKIAIPSTILSKPGKLTNEEFSLIRSHVKLGYEILQGIDLPEAVSDTVLHHHERLDGSGYPDGIGGDKLSMEANILGVCDVVEAMSSHRPYRPARSKQEIISELNEGKGKKYQPKIVDLMLCMLGNDELNICFQGSSAGEFLKSPHRENVGSGIAQF